MGRDDYYDDDARRPRRRSRRDEGFRDPYYPPRKRRSGAVTSVAVLNFVVGPVVLVFGLCGMLTMLFRAIQPQFIGVPGGLGNSTVISVMFVLAIFTFGTAAFVTAIGLLYRAGWARMLGLFLGGGAASAGLLYLTVTFLFMFGDSSTNDDRNLMAFLSALRTVFFLGYCAWTYIVLLHPRRLEEFS